MRALFALMVCLSIPLFFMEGRLGLSFPIEPLLAIASAWFLVKINREAPFRRKLFSDWMTWCWLAYLLCLGLSSLCSSLPMVALKSWLTKVWFIIPAYFMCVTTLDRECDRQKVIWAYLVGMSLVAIYTLTRFFLSERTYMDAFSLMYPFMKEHTNYGAMMAFAMPLASYLGLKSGISKGFKTLAWTIFMLLTLALFFSYSRAAWLSVGLSMGLLLLFGARVKARYIFMLIGAVSLFAWCYRAPITTYMEQKARDKSEKLSDIFLSSFNYSTNLSNLERLNRWRSGLRMWEDRPFLGHGAGTYQFIYGPYQDYADKTMASTDWGDWGKIDQEYLTPLVDGGLLTFICFMLGVLGALYRVIQCFRKARDRDERRWALAMLMALSTFLIHGFFNSFLELDKSALPFFALLAMISATYRSRVKRIV